MKQAVKAVLIVVGVFLVVGLLVGLLAEEPNGKTSSTSVERKEKQDISQNDAEKLCQDYGFLKNYMDTSNLKVVKAFDYKPYFEKSGENKYMLNWAGFIDDKKTAFTCYLSTSDGSLSIDSLVVGGNVIYGTEDGWE